MKRIVIFTFIAIYSLAAGLGFYLSADSEEDTSVERAASYILQGKSTEAVVAAVVSVDGQITHEFSIINAVTATLTPQQRDELLVNPAILAINEDAPVKTAGGVAGGLPNVYAEGALSVSLAAFDLTPALCDATHIYAAASDVARTSQGLREMLKLSPSSEPVPDVHRHETRNSS